MTEVDLNFIDSLTPEQREKYEQYHQGMALIEQRELYEESLLEFVKGAWSSIDGSEFQPSWVIDAMCDHLENVTYGNIKRLLINVPPRCSKTSIVSIIYPTWVWARSQINFTSGPQVKFLCASYNQDLTLEASTKSRRLIASPWFQKYWPNKIVFHSDQNTKTDYGNTFGGARRSTSVKGSLLGLGGDILIADDLNKVGKEDIIESDEERNEVRSFWSEFSSTRLNNPKKSAIIGVQQRLHQSDMSGLIIQGDEEYVHLMIPMRYDPERHFPTIKLPQYIDDSVWEDPRKYTGEELMWPERFGEKEVRSLEAKLGPFMASGRLQQMPTPKGGGIIKSDWWQLWNKKEAASYGLEYNNEPGAFKEYPPFDLVVGSLDTAYGQKEENDYSAMTVWGIWKDKNKNRRGMLVHAWQKRLPLHGRILPVMEGEPAVNFRERQKAEWGLIELIADTCKRYQVRRLLIEDKTRGRDVAEEINRLYERSQWGVELMNPVGDKVSRGHSVVPMFTDGMIWAPELKWSQMVIDQCALVPKSDHDDLYDTVTMFLHWARENLILIRGDEMSALLEDEQAYRPRQQSISEQYGV